MDKVWKVFICLFGCSAVVCQNILDGLGELNELNFTRATPGDFPETSTQPIKVDVNHKVLIGAGNSENVISRNNSGREFETQLAWKGLNETIADHHLDEHHHQHEKDHYPVAKLDFESYSLPFLVSIWLISACIAKIGET